MKDEVLSDFRSRFDGTHPSHDWLVVQGAMNWALERYFKTEPRVFQHGLTPVKLRTLAPDQWETSAVHVNAHLAVVGEGRSAYEAAYDLLSRVPIAVEATLNALPRPTVYERLLAGEDTDETP